MRGVYEMSLEQEDNADASSPSSFYLLPLSYPSECIMVRLGSSSYFSIANRNTNSSFSTLLHQLNCINTCLDVALSDRSSWQRLCLRKSGKWVSTLLLFTSHLKAVLPCFQLCLDDLVFMLEASLRVRDILALGLLTLVLVAILPDAQQATLGMVAHFPLCFLLIHF